ncbi:MAG: T9SS type A sorting domain-containing protein [Ignavibacteriaceae bacterium]
MRKKINLLISLLIVLILSGVSLSQTTHDVTVSNFSFSPAELIITVGDAVRWTNVSGTHNVLADDNSFTSGPPAPAPWEYTHTFTTAGNNPYYCEPHGGPGGSGMSGVITVMDPVSVPEDDLIADVFELKQNYPNPFNPGTKINFALPNASFVSLKVYDVIGNEVATLLNEEKAAGNYEIDFNAAALSGGIYFYQLRSDNFIETRKMTLLK